MGLENSEHIQNIVIDPQLQRGLRHGDRAALVRAATRLYKTDDGGQTWKAVLSISPDTGVTDLLMDPKNPDVLYAAAYQASRSRSADWRRSRERSVQVDQCRPDLDEADRGLPSVEIGRIGLAANWRNPARSTRSSPRSSVRRILQIR